MASQSQFVKSTHAGDSVVNPIQWDKKKEHSKDIIIANFEALGLDGAVFTAGKSGKIPYGQIKKYLNTGGSVINPGVGGRSSTPGKIAENLQFYYQPDHLSSSNYITNASGEVYQHEEYPCLVPACSQGSLSLRFAAPFGMTVHVRDIWGKAASRGRILKNPEILLAARRFSPIILKNRLSSRVTPMVNLCEGRRNEGSPRISRMPVKWDIIDIIIANFEALGLDGAVFTAGKSGKAGTTELYEYEVSLW